MRTIRKIRWFWSWNDLQEEAWLHKMSVQGLHLKEINSPCIYTFVEAAPADYVYKLDSHFNTAMFGRVGWYALADESERSKAAEADYQQLFNDAGWEYLGTNKGWRYFRQEKAQGEVQELYTDQASKVTKYRRQIFFQLAIIAMVAFYLINNPLHLESPLTAPWNIAGLTVLFLFCIPLLPLGLRLRQLQADT